MTKPISRQQRIRRWLDKPRLSRMRSIYRSFEGLIETFADAMFDRWHRLDFDGLIQQVDLATDHHASHLNAKHYEAVAGIDLRVIVEEALRVDATIENFIDLGSGKGKSCLYAARSFRFRRIIGVEFSAPLIAIANANKNRLKADNVDFILADAATYRIEVGRCIVYLYNPFDATILEAFLANNLDHFRNSGSLIAYVNDHQRQSITKFGFDTLFRDQVSKLSLYRMPE